MYHQFVLPSFIQQIFVDHLYVPDTELDVRVRVMTKTNIAPVFTDILAKKKKKTLATIYQNK